VSNKKLEPAYQITKATCLASGVVTRRREQIRPNELLYDHEGQPVAIKTNGQILAIIEDEL
jgi:hypothetical protein